jgi:hypothetical protein
VPGAGVDGELWLNQYKSFSLGKWKALEVVGMDAHVKVLNTTNYTPKNGEDGKL